MDLESRRGAIPRRYSTQQPPVRLCLSPSVVPWKSEESAERVASAATDQSPIQTELQGIQYSNQWLWDPVNWGNLHPFIGVLPRRSTLTAE